MNIITDGFHPAQLRGCGFANFSPGTCDFLCTTKSPTGLSSFLPFSYHPHAVNSCAAYSGCALLFVLMEDPAEKHCDGITCTKEECCVAGTLFVHLLFSASPRLFFFSTYFAAKLGRGALAPTCESFNATECPPGEALIAEPATKSCNTSLCGVSECCTNGFSAFYLFICGSWRTLFPFCVCKSLLIFF